jgi:hypothetical protein
MIGEIGGDKFSVIGGDKFSGKPGDWADVKTEIVSAIEAAGYSYITKMGAYLFNVAGSGDRSDRKPLTGPPLKFDPRMKRRNIPPKQ